MRSRIHVPTIASRSFGCSRGSRSLIASRRALKSLSFAASANFRIVVTYSVLTVFRAEWSSRWLNRRNSSACAILFTVSILTAYRPPVEYTRADQDTATHLLLFHLQRHLGNHDQDHRPLTE